MVIIFFRILSDRYECSHGFFHAWCRPNPFNIGSFVTSELFMLFGLLSLSLRNNTIKFFLLILSLIALILLNARAALSILIFAFTTFTFSTFFFDCNKKIQIPILIVGSIIFFYIADYLIENTNAGKKIVDDLKKMRQENITTLKPKEKSIKDLEDSINKKKNIISEKELNLLITDMRKKISEFRKLQNELMKNLDKKKIEELGKFVKLTVPIIENYMNKNKISIIVDKKNIFIATNDYNISEQLVPLINNQLK